MNGKAPDAVAARYLALYLALLKQTLTFSLWPEPPEPLEYFNSDRTPLKRRIVSILAWALRPRYELTKIISRTPAQRRDGEIWPYYADTMMGVTRLDHLHHCVETVLADGIPGDFIETGVWRGGGCIFMRGALAAHGITNRKIFVADSFRGFPPLELPQDADDDVETFKSFLSVPLATVQENFRRYGLLDDQVVFLEGWFKDTLPVAPIEQLAVLRLDGDLYSSTMDALTALYRKLAPGGFCIVDDYGAVDSCRRAVIDYRDAHAITTPIERIDWTGAFWRKDPA